MDELRRIASHLRRSPLLAELGADTLVRLAEHARWREASRREVVYLPGDPGSALLFVVAGRVKLSRVTRDGKALTLAYVAAPDAFGEACLPAGAPRGELAEATEPSALVELDRDAYLRALDGVPALGRALAWHQLARRAELEQKLEALVYRDVAAKLAEELLRLFEAAGAPSVGEPVALQITHQELANLIGATRETVSSTLSRFRRQRLLGGSGRRVLVLDLAGLRALT